MWLLRLAALAAAFFFLRWLWSWLWGSGARRAAPPARHGTLTRDPVCGTYVDADLSLRETRDGQTLHFCSERCRETYLAQTRQPREIRNPS